jgi:Gluconate 2-dehydrogenase subunit 3
MIIDSTRRRWILGTLGAGTLASIAAAREHAAMSAKSIPDGTAFEFFTAGEAAEVAAIAEQIIPSADGPGAREAGVIYFIDRALKTFDAAKQDVYKKGMLAVQDVRLKLFADSRSIAALSGAQQLQLVHAIEKTDFFEVMREHTLLGFLGDPSYGGNRDKVGWKHIHFEDRMAWQPPFGYYDGEQA